MAKFKPYKIESSQLEGLAKSEGQFIVTTDTQKVYLDETDSSRIELSPSPTKTSELINDSDFMSGMFIAAYGKTTYADVLDAYQKNHIIYCRASSSSNPASGNQLRMAFLAYVNNETTPTEFEFQYYRSVATHSDSQQGDQVYIYKLKSASGWENSVRSAFTKVVAGTGMSSSYNNGVITLNATNNGTVTKVTAGTGLTTGQSSADITSTGTLSLDTSGVTAGTYQGLTIDSYGRVTSASDQGYTTNTGTVTQVSAGTGLTGGDITTTGTIALDESGVTAGTYQGLTVDKYGRVTAASDQGYTSNTGTITGITMNGTSKGTSGVVDLGTVLTSYTETDPIYSASAASGITSSDITNWNNKTSNTGTITGVSVNGTSVATSGVANITSIPASTLTGAIPSAVTATTQSQGDNSTKIATTSYVDTAIDNLPEPMVFKGSLGTGGTITILPVDGSATVGDTYKVITDGTYGSKAAKIGDTFICLTKTSSTNTWELIPSGDEPSGTVTSVTIKATSPIAIDSNSAITTSGTRTLSHANSGVTAGTYKSVTVNATGHVTAGTNPTTLSGYGITDAKIDNGVITLGSNTITPLTSEVNSNLVNGSTTGSLRTVGSATEDSSYTIGSYAFAEGYGSKTSASYAHAEGMNTQATGSWGSHAEGYNTKATNNMAHAEGDSSTASGVSSHAENGSTASGSFSHSEGNTSAAGAYQHTQGRYNIIDSNNIYSDIIGNGTSDSARSNAATVDWNGNAWYAGDVYVGSTSGTNKDAGSVKLAKVSELPSAGTGINITSGVVTNTGVVNVETSPSAAGNGTIAVTKGTTSGTSTTYISVRGLNNAAYKDVDSSISAASTSTQLPTSQAVAAFVEGKGYLTSYTETDPVFTASPAYGITNSNITDWNNKISQYSTMPQASSETIGEIVQYIGTTDNTYTHGYFYEGDSIEVLDGETFETITTYVWRHIDVQSSNYLAKDNATLYTPTGNYNPATKKYVDDACAKDYEIYYWDGKSSSQTASNLQLFQDILDKHLAGKDILIVRNYVQTSYIYPEIYIFDHTVTPTTSSSTASYSIYSQVRMVKGISPNYSEFQAIHNKIQINMTAADVTTVTSVTTSNSTTRGTFLETEYNYGTPFVPTKDGHPASKKYVDDSISAISTGIHSFYGTTDPTTVTGSVDGDIYIVIDA